MSHEATKEFLGDIDSLEYLADLWQEFQDMIGHVIAEQSEEPYRLAMVLASLEDAKQGFMSLCTAIQQAQRTLEALKGELANVQD